jgi:hydroxymethylcytosylglucuronate/cytosylglucuronate synthase
MNVLAAAIPFGLGPAGKLATLVKGAPWIHWHACGDRFDQSVFEKSPFEGQLWSKDRGEVQEFIRSHHIDRALVVLDPHLALLIDELGIPVVYVDSLPFLWTDADAIPSAIALYCAQLCMFLPAASWRQLRSVKNLVWTQGIVPQIPPRPQDEPRMGQFMVNFGGLSSPHGEGMTYARALLRPLMGAIGKTDCRRLLVTSSNAGVIVLKTVWNEVRGLVDMKVEPEFVTLSQKEFLRETGCSELLVTSPGLTTLLETAVLEIPMVLLPPQNLSQYLNSRMHQMASPDGEIVSWPATELSFESLETFLDEGEEVVVRQIYRRIGELEGKPEVSDSIEATFRSCLDRARRCKTGRGTILDLIGRGGSAQVIELLTNL